MFELLSSRRGEVGGVLILRLALRRRLTLQMTLATLTLGRVVQLCFLEEGHGMSWTRSLAGYGFQRSRKIPRSFR